MGAIMGKKETAIQTKIIDWLHANHFHAIKVIVSSVDGTSDIIACSPKGRFIAIEVKQGANTASALQEEFITQVINRGGIGFVTWDLQTVIAKLAKETRGGYTGESAETNKDVYL